MKNKNLIWIIGAIVLVVLLYPKSEPKQASAGLEVVMTISDTKISPGESMTITYHPNTPNQISLVLDVPTGWTSSKTPSPDGKVRTTADGTDIVITWTAPNTAGTHHFTGQYSVFPDTDWTNFQGKVVTICSSHVDYACNDGDVYWKDSCGRFQEIKEECGIAGESCGAFGPSYCDGNTIKYKRTCTVSSCLSNYCGTKSVEDIQTNTNKPNSNNGVCGWSCSGSLCQQNTPADDNYDGCVADNEFPTSVFNWKNQQGGITDSIFPLIVSKWKNQENC